MSQIVYALFLETDEGWRNPPPVNLIMFYLDFHKKYMINVFILKGTIGRHVAVFSHELKNGLNRPVQLG